MRSALFVFALIVGGLSMQDLRAADSTATTPLPDAPYEVIAHPANGYFFRLSRKTGLVWYLARNEWKPVFVNTPFTVMDLTRPYPPQFQMIASKTSILWINCTDGKSAVLELADNPNPENWKFVDVIEPKK